MTWNLQSYTAIVLNERMSLFGGGDPKHTLTPPTYFQGSGPPQPPGSMPLLQNTTLSQLCSSKFIMPSNIKTLTLHEVRLLGWHAQIWTPAFGQQWTDISIFYTVDYKYLITICMETITHYAVWCWNSLHNKKKKNELRESCVSIAAMTFKGYTGWSEMTHDIIPLWSVTLTNEGIRERTE